MPFVGSIIPPSVLGADQRDRNVDRAKERRQAVRPGDAPFQRALDEAEISAAGQVEAGEAMRSVKGNENEESHEDRTEHGYYNPRGQGASASAPKPSVDVRG